MILARRQASARPKIHNYGHNQKIEIDAPTKFPPDVIKSGYPLRDS